MLDTKVGAGKKDDPAFVAKVGFEAMLNGDGDVVSGWKNKIQSAIANVTPAGVLAGAAPEDGCAGDGEFLRPQSELLLMCKGSGSHPVGRRSRLLTDVDERRSAMLGEDALSFASPSRRRAKLLHTLSQVAGAADSRFRQSEPMLFGPTSRVHIAAPGPNRD